MRVPNPGPERWLGLVSECGFRTRVLNSGVGFRVPNLESEFGSRRRVVLVGVVAVAIVAIVLIHGVVTGAVLSPSCRPVAISSS